MMWRVRDGWRRIEQLEERRVSRMYGEKRRKIRGRMRQRKQRTSKKRSKNRRML